ncbi:MAG: hypothetical protein HGA65_06130, partial [Oscillochloris sp.]|nr:hypothetical protein [Oscillochloris sp.]
MIALAGDQNCPEELRALALAVAPVTGAASELLQQTLTDPNPNLRRSALAGLAGMAPDEQLKLLGAALGEPDAAAQAVRDLLNAASQLPQQAATGLLAHYALREQGGVDLRIVALRHLADRPDGVQLLPRFLSAERLPTPLRAAAARLVGVSGIIATLPQLRQLLLSSESPSLRRAAAAALASIAHTPAGKTTAVAVLIEALSQPEPDAALTARIADTLGAVRATTAIPALGTLLYPNRAVALRAGWLAALPTLASTSAVRWPDMSLSPGIRAVLLDTIAVGETLDDQPSNLEELSQRQAEQTMVAAASALAKVAQQRLDLAGELCSRIRRALLGICGLRPSAALFAALAQAAGETITNELEAILNSPESNPALRWAALDQLGSQVHIGWLLERLRAGNDDNFIQAKLIATLGDLKAQQAISDLRVIALDTDAELSLRICAAEALGSIGGVEGNRALLSLIRAGDSPLQLRITALDALHPPLSDDLRQVLRQIAHAESSSSEFALVIGRVRARAGEPESLALLLRAALSEQTSEAGEAIYAIGELGDPSASSSLVRISQSPVAAPSVRLAAVAALLQIDGPGQLPLLRAYLESPILPLRLKAHQILAQVMPDAPQLLAPLSDPDAPLSLRSAALDRLAGRRYGLQLLSTLIQQADEPAQLRLAVADALGQIPEPESARALLAALKLDGPPLLRRRCVTSLAALAGSGVDAAEAALAALAQETDTPIEVREWATDSLLDHMLDRSLP